MEFFNSGLGKNITFVRPAYFVITGFIGTANMNSYYVFLFLIYIVTVLANVAVMAVICVDRNLRTPKYMAIFSLALADFLSGSALVPKVLDIFLFHHQRIGYSDCLTFLFFYYTCLSMQALNLVALAFDRAMAILYPLHYRVKVTNRRMLSILLFFWTFSAVALLHAVGLLTRLSFCRSVEIQSFFCDHGQMYRLACNDRTPSLVISFLLPLLILWLPLGFILGSYLCIGYALTKVASTKERLKALKTCTAHVSLVVIFFFPIIVTYTTLGGMDPNARIVNLSLASIVPSMLNPIIYVLQTQEIKESLKKLLRVKMHTKLTVTKVSTL